MTADEICVEINRLFGSGSGLDNRTLLNGLLSIKEHAENLADIIIDDEWDDDPEPAVLKVAA